jgi:hypothetical protein
MWEWNSAAAIDAGVSGSCAGAGRGTMGSLRRMNDEGVAVANGDELRGGGAYSVDVLAGVMGSMAGVVGVANPSTSLPRALPLPEALPHRQLTSQRLARRPSFSLSSSSTLSRMRLRSRTSRSCVAWSTCVVWAGGGGPGASRGEGSGWDATAELSIAAVWTNEATCDAVTGWRG